MQRAARSRTFAAWASAAAGAAAIAAAAAPPGVHAPAPGTPCDAVTLPRGTRLPPLAMDVRHDLLEKPDSLDCVVVDARYTPQIAVVTWAVPVRADCHETPDCY